jgi:ATP phosphoribosyltransferase regulatory subunit
MADTDGPLRFCYQGAVTRLSQGARLQREVLQAGVELIGADSPDGDAEVIAVAAAALALIEIPHIRLDIGHVAPARYALGQVRDAALRREIAVLLCKKDRAGVARVTAGLPADVREVLVALPTLWGPASQVLSRARALPWPDDVRQSIELLASVLAMSRDVVEAELHSTMTVDLGEVRGFEYYTGIRFAGYADGVGDAVLRGGRYDELIGRYGNPAHATGFAVDIEAIAQAQHSGGVELPETVRAVLVVTTRRERQGGARIAAALRAQGWRAAVDLGQARALPALIDYAGGVGFSMILELEGEGAQCTSTGLAGAPARPVACTIIEQALRGDARLLIGALEDVEACEAPGSSGSPARPARPASQTSHPSQLTSEPTSEPTSEIERRKPT